ncbi:MAG TPA: hypothetical protein VFX58_03730 [Chitinophagaceae bacterium]|nr:hypothetical protein [Chitinophagaceae bacterium]
MQRLLMLGSAMVLTLSLSAQQFGGTPPSQKWKQIETDTARIIFPEGLDSTAHRMASIVHYMAAAKPASLGDQLRRINIVLQHQTTVPNGYVGLGPFRSEFFLTPVSNNFREGSISWPDQLALHEYRHVQQYNNFRNGLSRAMYYLFGEEGLALAINAAIPDWFYEGDAVHQETILSKQGRGRLPLFLNAYPSLWQANKNYSWMKLRNGSFKDYVPNHYELGYLLVNYGYAVHGADFWKKVSKDASSFKGLFYPFQQAIKKHAGEDYQTFRQKAFDWYKAQVSNNQKEGKPAFNPSNLVPVKKSYVNNYFFPYSIGPDSVLYLKSTYRHRPAFYIHDKNGEHRLRARDISLDEQYSYRNGRVVYTAFEPHPRWGWKDYSVIKFLDLASGRQRTISRRSRYFTPDISFSGKRIAAVEIDPWGKTELHILDSETGRLMQRIRSSDILVFTDPKFINEDSLVTAVRLLDGKMALALAEISTGNTMRLTPPSYNVVGYPSVENGMVYFTASYQGNDDVYALELSNQKIYKLTNGTLGKYFVNAGNGKLNWSEFTAEGYQLMQSPENKNNWTEVDKALLEQLNTKFSVSQPGETGDILLQQLTPRQYATKVYKKSTRLLNFHSWRPYYEDPIFTYSLYGENVLNTLQTELYYLYNQDERTSAIGLNAVFGGLFPYLQAGTEFTFDRQGIQANRVKRWNQLDTRAGFSIPLNFTGGRSYKFFNVGSYYVLRNEFNKGFFKDSIGNTTFSYLLHTISWSQQVERALQHIFPRLGYAFGANHRHAISSYEGYQFIGNASLYLPGILPNHSLVLNGSIQQRDTLRALFSTRFASARGYEDYYRTTAGSRLWRLSANYHLPLFLPDWGFANILYIQRIRANLFYDFQRLFSNDKRLTADLRSTGIELYADTKWWNQYPLTFGIRISRILDDDPLARNARNSNLFEFILPVSIIPR